MPRQIVVAPTGPQEFGIMVDDAGATHVAWRMPDQLDGADLVITFELPHFVGVADHMASIADTLVRDSAGE